MPSLRSSLVEELAEVYELAFEKAIAETGLPESSLPSTCPFTLDRILDTGFFPE